MYSNITLTTLLLTSLCVSQSLAGYTLTDTYDSSNFFNGAFDFFTGPDPTQGAVQYVDQTAAITTGLVQTFDKAVFLGVDNVSNDTSATGRSSVRISSKKAYNHGLVIADIAHMPGGVCGTWPSLWMLSETATWPLGGEIDIIEGANSQASNQMTLHTDEGCRVGETGFSGHMLTSNCDVDAEEQDKNAGCGISDSDPTSFGKGFNDGNGGIYAMEWTSDSISVFFFDRFHIPKDITSGHPLPQYWGTPIANFTGGCNIDGHFRDLQIVFDTTFCGAWAGNTWNSESTCSALAPTCEEFVATNPAAFGEAYWEINSVKVYETQNP